MKRFITVTVLLLIMISLLLTAIYPVSAQTPSALLVLGDSISTGYGLLGTQTTCASYGNQLAQALGLEGDDYRNLAVNGATSADLLALLPKIENSVKYADTIVISIGGNDILGKVFNLLYELTGTSSIAEASQKLSESSPENIAAMFSAESIRSVFTTATEAYATNLLQIINMIKSANPDARVILHTLYNPLSGAKGFTSLEDFAESVIGGLNAETTRLAAEGSCELLDVYTAFAGKGGQLTKIYLADIHPNQAGHDAIYAMLLEMLSLPASVTAPVPDTTAPAPQTTTPIPETTAPAPQTTAPVPETTAPAPQTASTAEQPSGVQHVPVSLPLILCAAAAVLCMAVGIFLSLRKKK